MYDSKMLLTQTVERTMKVNVIVVLSLLFALTLTANSFAFATGQVKDHGILTSIEENGTVIINEKGYLLSSSVIVRNGKGDSISLTDLLSQYVEFQYEYTPKGFVITLIKEVPQ